MQIRISLSKKSHKKSSDRSKFFSILMKELAGDPGNTISSYYVKGNAGKLRKALTKVVDNIVATIENDDKKKADFL